MTHVHRRSIASSAMAKLAQSAWPLVLKGRAGIHWDRLPHCNLHSPSGFEVGYCGSGPADTAASILADYFGEEREFVERAWRGRWQSRPSLALKLHQSFKFEVIAAV